MRCDEGIDVIVCDTGVSDHAEEGAHRMRVTCRDQNTTENTVDRGVPHVDDFVGLHFEDFIAFGNSVTF
ncbi:MAG: Uncharacterised protein [Halieaceae bacterium]|nr:MAG: Uncharacterised protein [Halieaceae bacterium]